MKRTTIPVERLMSMAPLRQLLSFCLFSTVLNGAALSQVTLKKSLYIANENRVEQFGQTKPQNVQPIAVMAPRGLTANDLIRQQQENVMNQMGYRPPVIPKPGAPIQPMFTLGQKKKSQIEEIQALLNEDLPEMQHQRASKRTELTKHYRAAFNEIMAMYNGSKKFSLKDAVFAIENAYLDKAFSYDKYSHKINERVTLVRNLMQKQGIPEKSDLGKNYMIQQLFSKQFSEQGKIYDPYSYDFDDFWGEKEWANMFVAKLVTTGKGQCHSMPLLYLILAEELDAKAWLSLSPEHSFIIFNSDNGPTNFETTNGHVATDDWFMESGFINSNAVKNKIYLDTLGKNGLFSTLFADLVMGYSVKFGYDDFMRSVVDKLLEIYPKSVQGQILRADIYAIQAQMEIKKAGDPPQEQWGNYPEVKKAFERLNRQYTLIDDLGFSQMPKEKYSEWRSSGEVSTQQPVSTDD